MIETIRSLAEAGRYRITLHAREEMDKDRLTTDATMDALASPVSVMIEDYPEDRRGHSHLVLAWLSDGTPAHVCCAIHEDVLVIITAYRPDVEFWETDWRTRL